MPPTSMQGIMWVFKHVNKHVTSFNHASSIIQQLTNMLQHTRSTCNKQRDGLKHDLGSSNKAQNSGRSDQNKGPNTHAHPHMIKGQHLGTKGGLSSTLERGIMWTNGMQDKR